MPFFGTCQKDDEGKKCQVENGDGVRGKGSIIIWYRSGVSEFMGKFWYETVSVWKVVFFVY